MSPRARNILVLGALAIAAFTMLSWSYARAQSIPKCAPRAQMADTLKRQFQEEPAFAATSRGIMMEIFISPKGTWSLVALDPDGNACILLDGKDWSGGPAGRDA